MARAAMSQTMVAEGSLYRSQHKIYPLLPRLAKQAGKRMIDCDICRVFGGKCCTELEAYIGPHCVQIVFSPQSGPDIGRLLMHAGTAK